MTNDFWLKVLGRTTPDQPVHLDDLITGDIRPSGTVVFPQSDLTPSAALWAHETGSHTYIGIRIHEPPHVISKVARLLAAAAIEREVFPVILSRVDISGFEQFGFRIERIPEDEDAARAAEEEIRKFWDLAIIIEGHEIGLLG